MLVDFAKSRIDNFEKQNQKSGKLKMNYNKFIINETNELIVKGSHKKVLLYAFLFSIPCVGLLTGNMESLKTFFLNNLVVSILTITLFYGIPICFWFKVFDKSIKLIINKNGIWNSKSDFIVWDNLWYFHIKEEFINGEKYHFFIFKIKNNEIDYRIDVTFYDKTYIEILQAIKINSEGFSIIDLGFETNK